MTRACTSGDSDSRLATTNPEVPPPTIMKSKERSSRDLPAATAVKAMLASRHASIMIVVLRNKILWIDDERGNPDPLKAREAFVFGIFHSRLDTCITIEIGGCIEYDLRSKFVERLPTSASGTLNTPLHNLLISVRTQILQRQKYQYLICSSADVKMRCKGYCGSMRHVSST